MRRAWPSRARPRARARAGARLRSEASLHYLGGRPCRTLGCRSLAPAPRFRPSLHTKKQPVGLFQDMDEDALLGELAELEQVGAMRAPRDNLLRVFVIVCV